MPSRWRHTERHRKGADLVREQAELDADPAGRVGAEAVDA